MTALALPLLRSSSRSRAPALLLVLGLHIGLGLLLTRSPLPALQLPQRPGSLQLIEVPAAPNAPSDRALNAPPLPAPPRALAPVPLPEFRIADGAPQSAVTVAPGPVQPAAPAAPALPGAGTLDLRLPSASARPALPGAAALTEQLRHDPRANTPMASGAQRMAEAFGAKGWTVIDLGDGSHKAFGPHGECQIVRPSMVDGIPDHPHAGLLPNRVFACGGIEKGSLQHARPHERKNR